MIELVFNFQTNNENKTQTTKLTDELVDSKVERSRVASRTVSMYSKEVSKVFY